MTQVLDIGTDDDAASKFLESYVQSGNLNFLIGSGASTPAIKTAANIETEINDLIAAGEEAKADPRSLEFINQINAVHAKILANNDATVQKVANGYSKLVSSIDSILLPVKIYCCLDRQISSLRITTCLSNMRQASFLE
jgi:hypothetical protein